MRLSRFKLPIPQGVLARKRASAASCPCTSNHTGRKAAHAQSFLGAKNNYVVPHKTRVWSSPALYSQGHTDAFRTVAVPYPMRSASGSNPFVAHLAVTTRSEYYGGNRVGNKRKPAGEKVSVQISGYWHYRGAEASGWQPQTAWRLGMVGYGRVLARRIGKPESPSPKLRCTTL